MNMLALDSEQETLLSTKMFSDRMTQASSRGRLISLIIKLQKDKVTAIWLKYTVK
jgi:hypothetical protein